MIYADTLRALAYMERFQREVCDPINERDRPRREAVAAEMRMAAIELGKLLIEQRKHDAEHRGAPEVTPAAEKAKADE